MAAAYTNSLQALNGIYGVLERIIKDLEAPDTPQKTKERNENTVKQLNRGGLSGVSGAEKVSGGVDNISTAAPNSIRDISSALLSLPPAIRAVGGLSDRAINNVVNVLKNLDAAFSNFDSGNNAIKGTTALKNLTLSLIELQKINFLKLLLKFKVLENIDLEKSLGKTFDGFAKAYKKLDGLKKEDFDNFNSFIKSSQAFPSLVKQFSALSPLMPVFTLSVAMFAPGMSILAKVAKKMPSKNKMEAAAEAAKMMTSFVNSSMLVIAAAVGLSLLIQRGDTKSIITGLGITIGVISIIGGLALVITKVAGKSRGTRKNLEEINDFIFGLGVTTGLVFGLAALYTTFKDTINQGLPMVGLVIGGLVGLAIIISVASKMLGLRREVRTITRFIGSLVLLTGAVMVLGAIAGEAKPLIVQGLGIVLGVLGSIMLLALVTGALMKAISPVAMGSVMTFMAFSLAMVLGTMLIGAIVANETAKQMMIAGLGTVVGIVLSYTLLAMLVAFLGSFVELSTPFLKHVITFAGFSLGLVLGTILVGAVVKEGWDLLMYGLGGVTGVVLAYTGILALVNAISKSVVVGIEQLKVIGLFAAGCLALAYGTALLGALIKNVGPEGMIGAIVLMGLVIKSVDWVSQLIVRIARRKSVETALPYLKNIGLFLAGIELLAGGVIALGYAYKGLGDTWDERLRYIGAAFGLVTAITIEAETVSLLLARTRKTVDQGVIDIKSTLLLMGGAELLAGGILGLAYAFKDLGDSWGERLGYTTASFGLVTAIVLGAWAIAKYAIAKRPEIDQGAVDIKSTLLLMGGAVLIAGGIIGLAYALRDLMGGSLTNFVQGGLAIAGVFGLITGIIYGAAKLSDVASKMSKSIQKGAVNLLLAEGVIAGAEVVLFGAIELGQRSKGKEEDTLKALGLMTLILAEAGGLAWTASKMNKKLQKGITALALAEALILGADVVLLATIGVGQVLKGKGEDTLAALGMATLIVGATGALAFAAGKLKTTLSKGIPVLALIEALALGSVLVLGALVKVSEAGEGRWDQVLAALGTTEAIILATGAVAFAAAALIVGPQALWFAAGAAGVALCEELAYKGAEMLSAMIETVDTAGDAEQLKTKSKAAFETMKSIISDTSKMTAMSALTAAKIVAGSIAYKQIVDVLTGLSGSISSLVIFSKALETSGTTSEKLKLDIANLLSSISPEIFLDLFNNEDTGTKKGLLRQLIELREGRKSYESMIKLVKSAVDIYSTMLTGFKNKKIDPDELSKVATTIMNSIENFAGMLNNIDVSRGDRRDAERLSQSLVALIQPISDFAELISKYSGDGSTLKVITYDEKGYAREGKTVNVIQTATTLITAVTKFCEVLYDEKNRSKWEQLSLGSSKDNPSALEKGIGVFAAIIEPVSKFAELLTMFDAKDDNLIIPEYDKDGNLVANPRSVNVRGVASLIAGAVTTFIEELYVNHKAQWTEVLNSLNQIDPSIATDSATAQKTGNAAGLKDAIGIFGEILNPVLNFASVLLKFGTDKKDTLTVIDEQGKAHPVDVAKIAGGIASAVTTFISSIAGIFTNEDTINSIDLLKENSLTVLDVLNGFIENVSNAANIDAKKLGEITKTIPEFVKTLNTSISDITTQIPDEKLNAFTTDLSTIQTALKTFIAEGITASDVAKYASDTSMLLVHTKVLLTFIKQDDVTAFETLISELKNFMTTSVTELLTFTSPNNINIGEFTNSNITIANTLKNSYLLLFESVAGEPQQLVIKNKVTLFREFLDNMVTVLTASIISDDDLVTFKNKMIDLRTTLAASVLDMVDIKIPDDAVQRYSDITTTIRAGLDRLLATDIPQDNITRFESMYTSLKNTVNTLINEDEITNVDTFNKNFETLTNNMQSASQTAKVKKINTFSDAIKRNVTEFKGFDKVLNDGNKTRIRELDNFGKAVDNIAAKVNGAKQSFTELKEMFNALSQINSGNMEQIGQMLSSFNTFNGGGFGRFGEERTATIDPEKLAAAIANKIGELFEGAQIRPNGIVLKQENKPSATGNSEYKLDGAFDIDVNMISTPNIQGPYGY